MPVVFSCEVGECKPSASGIAEGISTEWIKAHLVPIREGEPESLWLLPMGR